MKVAAVTVLALAGAAFAAPADWMAYNEKKIAEMASRKAIEGKAKNIILFVADGNGVASNYATRVYAGQSEGGYGDDYDLSNDKFPYTALVKTYNTNAQTPDSAGTATAFNSGIKTKAGVVGLAEGTIRGECDTMKGNEVLNFAQQAHSMGKRVGVISTARITHATPACVYAQSVDRNFEAEVPEGCGHKDIASQLLDAMSSDCHYIDLAMGGGRAAFLPEDTVDSEGKNGYRLDGRDLIEEAKAAGVDVVQNTKEFQALKLDSDKPVLGLFESSHMMYEYDRQDTNEDEPSLAEMTAAAIEKLSASGDGFYLMIEAGRVDHANHGGNLRRMMDDGVAYNDAIAKAMELVDLEETLIISTADHAHALTFVGYCGRGSPIDGLCLAIDNNGEETTGEPNLANDGLPYTAAIYGNGLGSVLLPEGPNYVGKKLLRQELTMEIVRSEDYLQEALLPVGDETHSAVDVALYAAGPYAHLVGGTVEQTYVYALMKYALCGGVCEDMPATKDALTCDQH